MKLSRSSYLISPSSSLSRGFTIVETLVAIAILMIAVAGPLVVASKGLTTAIVSKDQMVASYLAQETMETLKNIRDNNLAAIPPHSWYQGIKDPDICETAGDGCDVNGMDGKGNIEYCSVPHCVPIYYYDQTGYTHNPSGATRTKFNRYFYIEDLGLVTNGNREVIARVIVEWYEGTVPYQIALSSQMVMVTR